MINFERGDSNISNLLEAHIERQAEEFQGKDLDGRDEEGRIRTRKFLLNARDDLALERIIGARDLMGINFLSRGVNASRSVCRIRVRNRYEQPSSHGSGFLVAPGLLLTNNHVLNSPAVAANSVAEFDVELDENYVPKAPRRFSLRPDQLFFTDKSLDFTFVRVSSMAHDDSPLLEYKHLPLIPRSGKAVNGEYVSIIQHPGGGLKQVVVRESSIVDLRDCDTVSTVSFIHYTSDTEPGSSGSPVLNDQWQVVALHHKAIPKYVKTKDEDGRTKISILARNGKPWTETMGTDQIKWIANQGVRISGIFRALRRNARFDSEASRVLAELDTDERLSARVGSTLPGSSRDNEDVPEGLPFESNAFKNIKGYDPSFLNRNVPLPKVTGAWKDDVAQLKNGGTELKYQHFSIVMSVSRRLAYFTAVNIDGGTLTRPTTKPRWRTDDRLDDHLQIDNALYKAAAGETFDIQRGHLVRRLDPVWGSTQRIVNRAVDHTYHYTNAAPQGASFNDTVWGDLEDFILKRALDTDHKVTVFSGPIFDDENDPFYREDHPDGPFQIPMEYWKVVVFQKPGGQLSATAYKQGQPEVRDFVEARLTSRGFRPLSPEERELIQLRISELEDLTMIDFGNLKRFDPMGRSESTAVHRPIGGLEDILL